MRQLSFFANRVLFFGGDIAAKGRKQARPLDGNLPLHLVLMAGSSVLYANRDVIYREIQRKCRRFGIKAYSTAVNHDHVHMILRVFSRARYHAFVRTLSAALASSFLWRAAKIVRSGERSAPPTTPPSPSPPRARHPSWCPARISTDDPPTAPARASRCQTVGTE